MKKSVITSIVVVVVLAAIVILALGMTGNLIGDPPKGCADSDGGKDYFTQGSTTYENRNIVYMDECTSDIKLKEYYCFGDDVESERYLCRQGCVNGACLEEE